MSGFGTAQLPKPGDIVAGKYSLERIIGQGGMGAVFAARHVKLGHAVAIKVMLADRQNEEAARRFMNEGRASANIQNDHVVRIFDIDEEHGYAYMVLELLQGEDLAQVLEQQGRLAPHVAVGYVLQALEGVRQAHALGIVHRDLKPSNLFLAKTQGGSVVVKVLDFGISKAGGSALDLAPHQQTSTAAMLGSPLYMSPEQLRSSKSVDARADIWAMGVIMYELLTGAVPFDGETLGALFAAILESEAPRVSAKVPEVPPGLDAIIARCLQRRPEDRFGSVADLERELTPFATAQPAAAAYPLMMTAAMPPPTAAPPGARVSVGSAGAPMALGSPAAATGYAVSAQSSQHMGPQQVVAPGTVPLGAITPQPYQQTGNTWQSTGSGTRPAKSGSVGLVIGMVFAAMALVGGGLLFITAFRHPGGAGSQASASASGSSAASANVAAAAGMPSAAPSGAADVASASAPPAASAPSSAVATGAGVATAAPHATTTAASAPSTRHPSGTPVAKVDPKPAEPAKVDPPPAAPPAPRPPPAATPAGGTLQNGR